MNSEEIKQTLGNNPNILKQVFNNFFALTEFVDVKNTGAIYCPFHPDEMGGKPSAKFFIDEDGIERIYCFSENKQFTAYEALKLLQGKNPLHYLLSNISLEEISDNLENLDTTSFQDKSIEHLIKDKSPQDIIEIVSLGERNE